MLLRPHQIKPANWLHGVLATSDSAVDLSDTGTGKTYVAAYVANRLKLPTLVVCPKIAISSWHRAALHFGDCFSVTNYERLRTGRTPYGKWTNNPPAKQEEFFVCQSCQCPVDLKNPEPCYTHSAGIHCVVKKKREWNYGKFNFDPRIGLVIFDEVHRCGGIGSLNGEFLIAAKRQRIKHLGLSATAACTPLQLRALGYSLGLHTLTPIGGLGFYEWAAKYGCRREPNIGPGVHWLASEAKQRQIMAEIHSKIIPARGVRVRTEDIPGFPTVDISAELYDLDDPGKIDALYTEMSEAILALEERKKEDIAPESALTKILRARQQVELLKVPIFTELARDAIAKGFSVGLFVNFRQTIDELSKRLETKCIIDGSVLGIKNRQGNIDQFQLNRERIILLNNEAGGVCVNLQDLDGWHPRIGFVSPPQSAVSFIQLCGRFPREGGKSKSHYRVVLAAKSVEEKIQKKLQLKMGNLEYLNDGDFSLT